MCVTANFDLPLLFDDLEIGIMVHDPASGDLLAVNDRVEQQYGYSGEQLRQMRFEEYTAPSTRFSREDIRSLIEAAADGEAQRFELQIKRANGELLWTRIRYSSATIDGVTLVIGEVQEITEYRARERRLRLLSRVIRHNLRNKVTVINGHASRIKQAVEDETLEAEVETVLDIAAEIGGLSESVSQLEEIAEPDATERSATNVCTVIEATVEEARSEHPAVDLTIEMPDEVWVVADRGVRYAIDHAIENAIRHNDRDDPDVTVSVAYDHANDRGAVRIADNGPKIPDTEIEVLNDAVEKSSTYHGTGVGLWVMQWCVNSLGGELSFEENTPRGNVVCISLPKADPA